MCCALRAACVSLHISGHCMTEQVNKSTHPPREQNPNVTPADHPDNTQAQLRQTLHEKSSQPKTSFAATSNPGVKRLPHDRAMAVSSAACVGRHAGHRAAPQQRGRSGDAHAEGWACRQGGRAERVTRKGAQLCAWRQCAAVHSCDKTGGSWRSPRRAEEEGGHARECAAMLGVCCALCEQANRSSLRPFQGAGTRAYHASTCMLCGAEARGARQQHSAQTRHGLGSCMHSTGQSQHRTHKANALSTRAMHSHIAQHTPRPQHGTESR